MLSGRAGRASPRVAARSTTRLCGIKGLVAQSVAHQGFGPVDEASSTTRRRRRPDSNRGPLHCEGIGLPEDNNQCGRIRERAASVVDRWSLTDDTKPGMTATCYRCTALAETDPGKPFGACIYCQSFACITCGVRAAGISQFYCAFCITGLRLLPSGGLPPTGGGGSGGGSGGAGGGPGGGVDPSGPPSAGPGDVVAPYESVEHFEALEP